MTVADKKKNSKASPEAELAEAPLHSNTAGGGESVDRIRQIIFGSQMEDYEQRFSHLESRLVHESAEIRKDLISRFETLEKAMHREIKELSKKLTAEGDSRSKATSELSKQLGLEKSKLEEKIRSDGERFDQLLQKAEGRSKDLLQSQFEKLQQKIDQLKGDKTDRAALAKLLREVAEQLEEAKRS